MKGRKPTATVLKMIRGNPGKRPLNQEEPQPEKPLEPPAAPAYLGREAKRVWRELAPELHRLGMVSNLDLGALAAYCDAEAMFRAACRDLRAASGLIIPVGGKERTVEKKSGEVVTERTRASYTTHPLLWIKKQALAEMFRFGGVLGLNPAERSRLKATPQTPAKAGWSRFKQGN